jgi:biopolymer transport protein ExbB
MNRLLLTALALGFAAWIGRADAATAPTAETLAEAARADLRAALDELSALRQQIEAERLPLAQQLAELEQRVLNERAALQRAQREEANQMVLLGVLRSEVQGHSNEVRALESLFGEYRRTLETRLPIAELARYREALREAAAAAEAPDLAPADKLARQLQFVATTLQRLEAAVGGDRFPGQALSPAGVVVKGIFLQFGPGSYFLSEDGAVQGVVEQRLNSPEPNVAELPPAHRAALRDLIAKGSGQLPVDPTVGNALRLQATRDPLAVHIAKGGPVMVPILALGAVALLIFTVKWLQVRRVRVATSTDLRAILAALEAGHRDVAERRARAIPGPVGEMLVGAVQHHREPKEYIEEVMYEKMLATRPRLERLVPFLALAAAAAPLLGLLGTVTGMINTFNMITVFGTGDPKTLAGGISEALITTEFGLIVAIPSLLLHAILSRKVKGVLASMEQTATAFINGLPDTPAEAAPPVNPLPSHA